MRPTDGRFPLVSENPSEDAANSWQQWLHQPQKLWLHNAVFQIHYWIGAIVGLYIGLMSVTGSIIVYRKEVPRMPFMQGLVHLHATLWSGSTGRFVNGIGGVCLVVLCLTGAVIWWPGIKNWRRSLQVSSGAHFARVNWDLHSALGFWCFPFILIWAVSGVYFAFPRWFDALLLIDPSDNFTDQALYWLSQLHFGRFSWYTQVIWSLAGVVPGILAFTGAFVCCRRVIFKKPSNPYKGPGHSVGRGSRDGTAAAVSQVAWRR